MPVPLEHLPTGEELGDVNTLDPQGAWGCCYPGSMYGRSALHQKRETVACDHSVGLCRNRSWTTAGAVLCLELCLLTLCWSSSWLVLDGHQIWDTEIPLLAPR